MLAIGPDWLYPKDHTGIFAQIQEMGAVVSEQPLGSRTDSRIFPRRNRLNNGLLLGPVMIEAAEGSGTPSHGLPRPGTRPGGVMRIGGYSLLGQRFYQADDLKKASNW